METLCNFSQYNVMTNEAISRDPFTRNDSVNAAAVDDFWSDSLSVSKSL